MIDLHTHTVFSDGELIPAELLRRAEASGYTAIAITDHVDFTNVEHVVGSMLKVKEMEDAYSLKVIIGVEITHVPPEKIERLVLLSRALGAEIVVVHGETPVEPVAPGTNRAAIEAGVDILAHPGFIALEEAELARENDVVLEITSRLGHNITNGHVVRVAKKAGAKMAVNTDTHAPEDLITSKRAVEIAIGAGLTREEAVEMVRAHPLASQLGLERSGI
ncbi:MAG: histidinol phosphate phosphatase domain-containing protein [Methanothrix sp.]|jgi:Histidinol phosphatase and related hydrolases of the PHP family|uniref:PHP C-terminal domain protein n=1 Tax=Methanothrix thermoacetophila (strain DSM 6194 / JCM 14653 / NBRC 101360 / PT) TaxID=349307 RepID=A0B7C7_METTP|nr:MULTISPECIES: histidinol phosphate phosphatase domain-containing protein [Methanothrix]ABK14601.1 PHP C-terminal domain protein [Methanothrix thermoacetophila PT]MBC7079128.1 histidinol phosphate phosphatase domain-containing protein [Methanothrix sp.]NPU87285.1 histidinol phosphate phosphatase domain-containing protein [Methanothrix sp.]